MSVMVDDDLWSAVGDPTSNEQKEHALWQQ